MRKHIFYLSIVLLLCSCRKDFTGQTIIEDQFIPTQTYERAGHGFVTDENDLALEEVKISIAGIEIITDQNGYFNFENVLIPAHGAYIQASKKSYFLGGHLINLESQKKDYIKISLKKKPQQKVFPSSTGGQVNFENGIQATIPSDAFLSAGNNYNGLVYAQAEIINIGEERFAKLFPSGLLSYKEDETDLFLQKAQAILAIEIVDEFENELLLNPNKEIKLEIGGLQNQQILEIETASNLISPQGYWEEKASNVNPVEGWGISQLGWWALGSKREKEKTMLSGKRTQR